MSKEPKYIIEKYCDEYNTLCQAIEINLYLDEQSDGLHSRYLRSIINPNLTILYERLWMDKDGKIIKRWKLNANNELVEEK